MTTIETYRDHQIVLDGTSFVTWSAKTPAGKGIKLKAPSVIALKKKIDKLLDEVVDPFKPFEAVIITTVYARASDTDRIHVAARVNVVERRAPEKRRRLWSMSSGQEPSFAYVVTDKKISGRLYSNRSSTSARFLYRPEDYDAVKAICDERNALEAYHKKEAAKLDARVRSLVSVVTGETRKELPL